VPADLKQRVDAVTAQINELFRLNHELEANFEHLSLAIQRGRQAGKISDEELSRLLELNRQASAAKHEGLGLGAGGPEPVRVGPVRGDEVAEGTPLGNHIGELERAYSLRLGRPLRKNEPRYRFHHRPLNIGDFVSIVCLDGLDPPMEFVGDSYRFKQDAKHSAALQAVLFLGLPEHTKPCPPLPASAACTAESGSSEVLASAEPPDTSSKLPAVPKVQKAASVAVCSARIGEGDCSAPIPGQRAELRFRDQVSQDPVPSQECVPELGQPVMPTDEAILICLREAHQPLAVREVYLLSLGRNPQKEQMGTGVKAKMNRRLMALQAAGHATSAKGLWSAADGIRAKGA